MIASTARRSRRSLRSGRAPQASAPAWVPFRAPAGVYVGPARVREVAHGRVEVRLADAWGTRAEVTWALPYRYAAVEGDVLLVVARGPRCYAVGVVRGQGRSEVAFRGDAALGARGRLRLLGDAGVRLVGRRLTLRAQALEVAARHLQERVRKAASTVRGLVSERAGAVRRVIEEDDVHVAGSRTIHGRDYVRLDGSLVQID